MALSLVYVTFPSLDAARELARGALDHRLAACATFWPSGSVYWWHGQIEVADEAIALFKTAPTKVRDLKRYLVDHHPYELPCILEWKTDQTHVPYEEWARAEVGVRRAPVKRTKPKGKGRAASTSKTSGTGSRKG